MTTDRLRTAVSLTERQGGLIDYDAVRVGDEFPVISFHVTTQDALDYRDAVGTPATREALSTMHLLALTLAAITARMPLPPTCVHVGQDLEWRRAVAPQAQIDVRFALVSRRATGGSTLSAFSLLLSSDGEEIARGRILLQS